MNKSNSILVVIDRTPNASRLIEKALGIARQFDAHIELFLCESEQAYELAHAYDREGIEKACAESIARARDFLSDLKARADVLDVHIEIEARCESPLYEGVVREVLRSRPALVVKATGGEDSRGLGVADPNDWQLMRTCPAALMLTRGKAWGNPPRFAAAVDVSEEETAGLPHEVMQAARTLACGWQAGLDVIYGESAVAEAAVSSHAEKLRSLCNTYGVTPERTHVVHGPPEQSLTRFARSQGYDALVLGALTHRPVGRTLVGTLTSTLFDAVDCDFVLVKPASYRSPIAEALEQTAPAMPAQPRPGLRAR